MRTRFQWTLCLLSLGCLTGIAHADDEKGKDSDRPAAQKERVDDKNPEHNKKEDGLAPGKNSDGRRHEKHNLKDKDRPGKPDGEKQGVPDRKARADQIFTRLDTNNDGNISREEFDAGAEKMHQHMQQWQQAHRGQQGRPPFAHHGGGPRQFQQFHRSGREIGQLRGMGARPGYWPHRHHQFHHRGNWGQGRGWGGNGQFAGRRYGQFRGRQVSRFHGNRTAYRNHFAARGGFGQRSHFQGPGPFQREGRGQGEGRSHQQWEHQGPRFRNSEFAHEGPGRRPYHEAGGGFHEQFRNAAPRAPHADAWARRDDDHRAEERRPEDRQPEDRQPEDRQPEDRQPEDRQPEDRRPEGARLDRPEARSPFHPGFGPGARPEMNERGRSGDTDRPQPPRPGDRAAERQNETRPLREMSEREREVRQFRERMMEREQNIRREAEERLKNAQRRVEEAQKASAAKAEKAEKESGDSDRSKDKERSEQKEKSSNDKKSDD